MPTKSVVHFAVFAAGAALGAAAAALAQKRNDRLTLPVTPPGSTSAISRNTEVSGTPVVEVSSTGNLGLARFQGVGSEVLKHGVPGPISDLISRKAYVTAYDRRLRHPAWTAEHLTMGSLTPDPSDPNKGDRSKSIFKEDESIPEMFRARLEDYFRSGYDRGHMVPAADAKFSQEAMDETFFLTNIAPQVGDSFNRHYWAYLENWCRALTRSHADVFVFTVPLYLPRRDPGGKWRVSYEVIGNSPSVGVPTHFAKVVLATRPSSPSRPLVQEISTGAFVLPNAAIPDDTPLTSFIAPVEDVEKAAGITLFSDTIKRSSKHICQTSKCEVVVRRFDDAQKGVKRVPAPKH